ncbi:MAG: C40 family peptidase [Cyclobacteriaceae bacterium]|nr:C40 family peptidase [Cyclobacteriaceae bacterium]
MMKGLSKSLLFFFLTTTSWLLTVPAQAQSDIRLEKLLRNKKFEKVIRFSQKRLQKGEGDSIAHYYLLAALLDKGSRARGTAGVPDFEKAFRHSDQYPNVHFSASHERQLKPKFRAAAVQLSLHYKGRQDSLSYYYVSFIATHFRDTLALYREYAQKYRPPVAPASPPVTAPSAPGSKVWIEAGEWKYAIPREQPTGISIVKKSEEVLGTPWKMGGLEPHKAFDCSGFVIWCYQQFGYELPHNTRLLASISEPVALPDAQPGDWVCFGSREYQPNKVYHIGMVHSREGDLVRMIHCGTSTGVTVAELNRGYWSDLEYFIVRLKGTGPAGD